MTVCPTTQAVTLRSLVGVSPAAVARPVQLLLPLVKLDRGDPDGDAPTSWDWPVRLAQEPCLLLDGDGRVRSLSDAAAELLQLDPGVAVGACLADLLTAVDFTRAARPDPAQLLSAPVLRPDGGGLGRALLRLRHGDGSRRTYDVVVVPLADRPGSLAFLLEV